MVSRVATQLYQQISGGNLRATRLPVRMCSTGAVTEDTLSSMATLKHGANQEKEGLSSNGSDVAGEGGRRMKRCGGRSWEGETGRKAPRD